MAVTENLGSQKIFKKEIKINYNPISLKYLLLIVIHNPYFNILSADSVEASLKKFCMQMCHLLCYISNHFYVTFCYLSAYLLLLPHCVMWSDTFSGHDG